MTETCRQIFQLTSGRLQLREVTVRLPAAWGADPTCVPPTTRHINTWTPADLRLLSGHQGLMGGQPWSIQPEGCGRRGRGHVEAKLDWVTNLNMSLEERAAALTKEWVKVEFGVFEEDGFPGDSIYPATLTEGRTNITNAGCSQTIQVRININGSTSYVCFQTVSISWFPHCFSW